MVLPWVCKRKYSIHTKAGLFSHIRSTSALHLELQPSLSARQPHVTHRYDGNAAHAGELTLHSSLRPITAFGITLLKCLNLQPCC